MAGDPKPATGVRSLSVGEAASASGDNSTAIGNQASAGFSNSAAIGNMATATRANQVMLGNADNTYTMAGLNSAASTSAQTGEVGVVTTDRNGNLAADYSLSAGLAANAGLISGNRDAIRENTAGIAAAIALDTPFVEQGKAFAINGGFGFYDDESAAAFGAAMRLNDTWQVNAGYTKGLNRGEAGGRVGFQASW